MRIQREMSVIQLTFLPRLFPVNCYLVEEEDGLTLIDTALPYSAKGILKAAKQMGKSILRICLTHAHSDHVGSLDTLKKALPHAPVYISHREARLLSGDRTLDEDEPKTPIQGGFTTLTTTPDILLQEGTRIGSLLAIATPGHTPGSMAFIDTRNDAMIVGDAFHTRGGMAVSGTLRPLFPFPALATWNKEKAVESARHIRECTPSLLASGHGQMLKQPLVAIDHAISQATAHLPFTY
ncbi:Glyoxylase, beta-lactamase superfamily II [Marininema mesophilum]|uniref:Glyoxylase, beta-lactamase superfamily II n=1 Tax=Marininema mesophilum TaxID=1048340 RepID=A0A1H3BCN4_9BACL|nr:MBL fold metallo-hydrolase [Marininema mesophilum]SDX39575.1 Glyoxylase, beta-lactamase superfamily II [Marininema mesophilum]